MKALQIEENTLTKGIITKTFFHKENNVHFFQLKEYSYNYIKIFLAELLLSLPPRLFYVVGRMGEGKKKQTKKTGRGKGK